MTVDERQAFLADLHVGVLSVADTDGRGPHSLPVWYAYAPGGEITFTTGRSTRKVGLIERAGRVSVVVQAEAPPYRYVSVEGPVVAVDDPAPIEARRAIATRYLGPEGAEGFLAAEGANDQVLLHIRPERWLTQDFSE